MSGTDPLLDALAGIVGPAHVLVDADVRATYETDWTGRFHGTARAVVRPGDPAEVAAALAACTDANAPVVPQGGNTGLVGGSVPRAGEVVVSLTRLDAVSVDAQQGEAIAGAGTVLEDLQARTRADGWELAVDLSSRGSCTIGGMVATNAGGEHVIRYGAMQDQLIGVEAALADGRIVGRIPALRKDNTGYHWEGLLAGSEGTLGVITRVHLRLVPSLPERVVVLVGVADLAAAQSVGARLRHELDELVALEVCFADGIDLVDAHLGLPPPFTPPAPVVLLAECAQRDPDLDALVDRLGAVVASAPEVHASAVATDERTRARFWSYREGHAEAINAAGVPHKLDVTLPSDTLVDFEQAVRSRVAAIAPDARVILFGHIGDGNLHVNVLGLPAGDDTVDEAVLDLVVERGGSISAEHGIGVAKRDAFVRSTDPGELAAMRSVKHALDPRAILNPGVLFPT